MKVFSRHNIASVAAVVAAMALAIAPQSGAAANTAWDPPNNMLVCPETTGDAYPFTDYCFQNYDLVYYNDLTDADNPITTLWDHNATGYNVSTILQNTSVNGSNMTDTNNSVDWAYFVPSVGAAKWFSIAGYKNTTTDSYGFKYHERDFDSVYDTTAGYFTIGDTREDNEGVNPVYSGYQEDAEHTIALAANSSMSCSGHSSPCVKSYNLDYYDVSNPLPIQTGTCSYKQPTLALGGTTDRTNHCDENDGKATRIVVN